VGINVRHQVCDQKHCNVAGRDFRLDQGLMAAKNDGELTSNCSSYADFAKSADKSGPVVRSDLSALQITSSFVTESNCNGVTVS